MVTPKQHKDERYRTKCFPGAEHEVMTPKKGGYFPFATVGRKLLKYLKDSELRVWVYLQARAGPWFITYPTYEEIQAETGLSKGAVSKAIKGLELKGFIRSCNDVGTRRYLIRDTRLAMLRLREKDIMSSEDFEDANYLLEALKQPTVVDPSKAAQQSPTT
jgi:DNA-binding MarR family transcriptional regulator